MPWGGDAGPDHALLDFVGRVAISQANKGVDPGAVVGVVPTSNGLPQADAVYEVEHAVALVLCVGTRDVECYSVGEVVPVLLADVGLYLLAALVDFLLYLIAAKPL